MIKNFPVGFALANGNFHAVLGLASAGVFTPAATRPLFSHRFKMAPRDNKIPLAKAPPTSPHQTPEPPLVNTPAAPGSSPLPPPS